MRPIRALAYFWALPTTMLGLPLVAAAAAKDGSVRIVSGVLEVHGPLVAAALTHLVPLPGGAAAITFGHIVAAQDAAAMEMTRRHERVHVRQCERWGPLFVPAYLIASAIGWARGSGAYRGNCFERQAYDECSAVVGRSGFTATLGSRG